MAFPVLTSEEQSELVTRIQAGDAAAEARLVDLFAAAVRAMTRIRARGAVDDQDVCQDVMIAAITAIRRGQLRQVERLGGFIAGIARNLINNQLRAQTSRPAVPLIENAAVADFREEVTRRERTTALRLALDEMGRDDRQVLILTLVEGLKSGEIAARLGLSPDVVRTRKARAIKRLTERLKAR